MEDDVSIASQQAQLDNSPQILPLASRIAASVHAKFNTLPNKCKPRSPDGSTGEWIPMSGIVAVKGEGTLAEKITCITVTTGARCLPSSYIPKCRGLVLHDSHAEILSLRAFNYWLLRECQSLISYERSRFADYQDGPLRPLDFHHKVIGDNDGPTTSPFIRRRMGSNGNGKVHCANLWPPFEIQPDIAIYMYCTCAPCGDASMELCMASQEDPTPWTHTAPYSEDSAPPPPPPLVESTTPITSVGSQDSQPDATEEAQLLDGRAYFSILGVVRRKPSRADAEPTRSKSCSDKLALRQRTSLLSHAASLFVAPTPNAYLKGLILPEDELSPTGCERAFGAGPTGRMRALLKPAEKEQVNSGDGDSDDGRQPHDRIFRPFQVLSIPSAEVEANYSFRKPKLVSEKDLEHQQHNNNNNNNDNDDRSISSSPTKPAALTKSQRQKRMKPGNVSAVWIAAPSVKNDPGVPPKPPIIEALVNGVKQGTQITKLNPRGASVLSRARIWRLVQGIVDDLAGGVQIGDEEGPRTGLLHDRTKEDSEDGAYHLRDLVHSTSYERFKRPDHSDGDGKNLVSRHLGHRAAAMRDAKRVLRPWIHNRGDEDWNLDVLMEHNT